MSAPSVRPCLAALVLAAACSGEIHVKDQSAAGQGSPNPTAPSTDAPGSSGTGSGLPPWNTGVAECQSAPAGFTYLGFDGAPLEGDRLDLDATSDRARLKSYDSTDEIRLEFDYGVKLLTDVKNDALATFEAHPTYAVPETQGGALMIYSAFRYGYLGCLKAISSVGPSSAFGRHPDLKSAPTAESAARQCQRFAQVYWNRDADEDEVQSCVDFALTGVVDEPNSTRRWALVCGAMAAAASNLTY